MTNDAAVVTIGHVMRLAQDPWEILECTRCVTDTIDVKFFPAPVYRKIEIGSCGTQLLWYRPYGMAANAPLQEHGVLVLRGGLNHATDITDTPYIRRLYVGLPKSEIFMLARKAPFIDVDEDLGLIDDALDAIFHVTNYGIRRTDLVGCSMGGIFLLNYLLNQNCPGLTSTHRPWMPNFYIMSSPLDVHRLQERINASPAFAVFFQHLLEQHGASTMEGLFSRYGKSYTGYLKACDSLYKRILYSCPSWLHGRIFIIYGKEDRLLKNNTYTNDFEGTPHVVIEIPGYHCSAEVINRVSKEIRKNERSYH